jgi:hypothetical protein
MSADDVITYTIDTRTRVKKDQVLRVVIDEKVVATVQVKEVTAKATDWELPLMFRAHIDILFGELPTEQFSCELLPMLGGLNAAE